MLTLILICAIALAFNARSANSVRSGVGLPDEIFLEYLKLGKPLNLGERTQKYTRNDVTGEGEIDYHRFSRYEWDFDRIMEWHDLAYVDDDSMELVVGLGDVRQKGYSQLVDLIRCHGGELINTVPMGGEIRAVVADIPFGMSSTFASRVETAGLSRYIEPNARVEIDFVPNDRNWTKQWGPRIIEADYAWNTTTGDPSILVAVIDTGIDWDHPDLAANYVPLGYDWVNNDTDPMDDYGHGTHCAGIIGAVINNSIGIAGLAQVGIMAEKALDEYGAGSEDDLANAIVHAVDQGAAILSNSWGMFGESTLIYEAVKYAHDHGALVVAAAGNDATECRQVPASYEEVIAVTATDKHDDPALWTNFGDWVEVAAPGVGVYSTWWNDTYTQASGTSMSTPHVAGVAALIWSQFPNMTRDQVRAQLRHTADDLVDPGFDEYCGYGRINARRAVEQPLPNHDLTLLYWKTPSLLKPFDTVTVNGTLLNFGTNSESAINVQLLVNGSVADSVFINHLASGMSTTISLAWSPVVEGKYNVTMCVEPLHDETSTENNILSRHVIVTLLEELVVPDDFSTIQKGINGAVSGYIIKVQPGTYHEHIVVDKALTLNGEDPLSTAIDGDGIEKVVWFAASNVNVSRFTIQNGTYGMFFLDSHNNSISDNTIENNTGGIWLTRCCSNTFTDNSMTGNVYNLHVTGYFLSHFVHEIAASNTVEGKPVYYLTNQDNLIIDDATFPDIGYLALVNSTNVTIRNLNITKNGQGVLLACTNSSTIENVDTSNNLYGLLLVECFGDTVYGNRMKDNLYAMDLWDSRNNTITENNITKCFDGICLDTCSGNLIQDNNVTLSKYKEAFGEKRWGIVFLSSTNNMVVNNEVAETHTGIYMVACSYNDIVNNTMADNGIGNRYDYSENNTIVANLIAQNSVGFHLKKSVDNVIYHNDIVNNEKQVQSQDSTSKWDDSYPSGGNYWSDYAGVDLCSGPFQNETGSDGIGDRPYAIDVDNQDRYPLWFPWGLPPAEHELTVFLEAPTIVPPGCHSLLKATVVNKGLNNETSVKLSLIIEADIVNSTTVSFLQAGSSYTVNCHWTPTVEGTYNITAFARPVLNEEVTTNNVVTKTVAVSIGTSVYVHPGESTVWPVETFTVDIIVNAVEDLYAWQVALYFNPEIISCTSTSCPSNHVFADRPFFFIHWIENSMGYVLIGGTLLGEVPTFTGSGILCQITFQAIGLGTSDLTFKPYADYLPDTFLLTFKGDLIPNVTLTDGVVKVEPIPGDVNGDGKVDIRDIAMAALAFGSFPGHPRWNPIADLNEDGKVDIKDIALIASNFGKSYI